MLRRQLSGKTAFVTGYEDIEHMLPQTNAKPRNACAKAIESYFWHTFENPLQQLNLPGYARRDHLDEKKNDLIQETLRRQTKGKQLLHYRDFFERVVEVLESWHSHTMTEDKPFRLMFLPPENRLIRFDDTILDFICWPAATRMVRNSTIPNDLKNLASGESANYNVKADYLSAHVGAGYQFVINPNNKFDLSLKYLWSNVESNDVKVAGDQIHFDSLDSHRLRLNGENSYQLNKIFHY